MMELITPVLKPVLFLYSSHYILSAFSCSVPCNTLCICNASSNPHLIAKHHFHTKSPLHCLRKQHSVWSCVDAVWLWQAYRRLLSLHRGLSLRDTNFGCFSNCAWTLCGCDSYQRCGLPEEKEP